MSNEPSVKQGKLLFITDVHGLIPQMNDFFSWLLNDKHENISYAIHLGDFWSGRNFNGKEQVFNEWTDRSYFDKFPFPLFFLRGNEDLTIPSEFWLSEKTLLMKEQEPFFLDNFKILPIDYHLRGEKDDILPNHTEYSPEDHFDFIVSHRPPLGLLDNTLHFETHKRLLNTGSPLVRAYVDMVKPIITFFGHFHYSNYLQYNNGLIVCIDKLIRISGKDVNKYRYSYALLDPFDQGLEVYWKGQLFMKYSLIKREIIFQNRFDRRNLYVRAGNIDETIDLNEEES